MQTPLATATQGLAIGPDMELPRKIGFGGWILDRRSGELSRDGVVLRLQVQPLQILEELLTHAGELVTREQLISRLWPKGVVDFDTGLNSAMRKLRIALGDDADTPRFIETIPRRGYRLVCPIDIGVAQDTDSLHVSARASTSAPQFRMVAFQPPSPTDQPASLRVGVILSVLMFLVSVVAWQLVGRSTPTIQPQTNSIVVLPFMDLSLEQRDQPFCDGLTEELSNWLSHLPNLKVVARTSAFAFKGKSQDVREIGKQLGVTHVLEGSCRRAGNDVRVTAQLTSASDGFHLWSKSFVMPLSNILQVEDAISRGVAEGLRVQLAPTTSEMWAARQPEHSDALELYLIARHHYRERTEADNQRAMDFYRRAIESDRTFALAYIGLAEAHINEIYISKRKVAEVSTKALPLLEEAKRLRPNLPELFAAEGWLQMELADYDKASTLLTRAIEMNPSDAASRKYLAEVSGREGRLVDAVEHYSRAVELDPLDFILYVRKCIALQGTREFIDAAAQCDRAAELQPKSFWPYLAKSWLAQNQGRLDSALDQASAAIALNPSLSMLAEEKGNLEILFGLDDAARTTFEQDKAATATTQALRHARVLQRSGDSSALESHLAKLPASADMTFDELIELLRLQHGAGATQGAVQTLARLKSSPDYANPNLIAPQYIRSEYSPALYVGAVEYELGNRQEGERLLGQLLSTLDRFEKNGAEWNGLYALRAQALAVLGRSDEAIVALQRAISLGWRASRRAALDGYFRGLESRNDYRKIGRNVEALVDEMRADFLERRGTKARGA